MEFPGSPKAAVIMETLTGLFSLLEGCGGHRRMTVFTSSLWAEVTTVVMGGGSLSADGTTGALALARQKPETVCSLASALGMHLPPPEAGGLGTPDKQKSGCPLNAALSHHTPRVAGPVPSPAQHPSLRLQRAPMPPNVLAQQAGPLVIRPCLPLPLGSCLPVRVLCPTFLGLLYTVTVPWTSLSRGLLTALVSRGCHDRAQTGAYTAEVSPGSGGWSRRSRC